MKKRTKKQTEEFKAWVKQAAAKAVAEGRISRHDLRSYAKGAQKVFRGQSV